MLESEKVLINLTVRNCVVRRKPTEDNPAAFDILKPQDNPHYVNAILAKALFDQLLAEPAEEKESASNGA
jgi:hypothetical protein